MVANLHSIRYALETGNCPLRGIACNVMTEATKKILKATVTEGDTTRLASDKEITDAETRFAKFCKDFFAQGNRAKLGINQAVTARIALDWMSESADDAVGLAVGFYSTANASQLRQTLIRAGVIASGEDMATAY